MISLVGLQERDETTAMPKKENAKVAQDCYISMYVWRILELAGELYSS